MPVEFWVVEESEREPLAEVDEEVGAEEVVL
jgi:hypothetical protein